MQDKYVTCARRLCWTMEGLMRIQHSRYARSPAISIPEKRRDVRAATLFRRERPRARLASIIPDSSTEPNICRSSHDSFCAVGKREDLSFPRNYYRPPKKDLANDWHEDEGNRILLRIEREKGREEGTSPPSSSSSTRTENIKGRPRTRWRERGFEMHRVMYTLASAHRVYAPVCQYALRERNVLI